MTLAERMYAAGVTDLIPIIPPGAQLTPRSKIPQQLLGKIPGAKQASGLWAGMNWRVLQATEADVRQWVTDGANIGLRTTRFPAVDIDCKDDTLASFIADCALKTLGAAPIRTGNPPKRLLLYRAAEPFGRLRLWVRKPSGEHLVEVLGEGQQAVMTGLHPIGREYSWDGDPAGPLTVISVNTARAFLAALAVRLREQGYEVEHEGDGKRATHTAADAAALLAPSIDALRECVAMIPNYDVQFPSRADYIRVGYAIRAAAGPEHDEDGCEMFTEWAGRWDAGVTTPEQAREDYRRMTGGKSVGWAYLAELARPYGFNSAGYDFEAIEGAKPDDVLPDAGAVKYSDQWLADECVTRYRDVLRYVPQRGSWLVWERSRWTVDADLQADDLFLKGLRALAKQAIATGVKGAARLAINLESAGRAASVQQVARSNRSLVVNVSQLDHDPWALNTPAGLVNLKTGALTPPNPDALATRSTAVAPSPMWTPEWIRFLHEATGGDEELIGYMQRLCGYCLTGRTTEQQLSFIYGPGQNGKSVFLNVLSGILNDYAVTSTSAVFSESRGDKHSTDIAMLAGARLVVASETTQGQRWNETLIKQISGGEKMSARFMRQDNFSFTPHCKLVFTGNHQPELRDVGIAIRRRIQMVPFTITPAVRDDLLGDKLREEWPGILAWMIEGCVLWQKYGLKPPPIVLKASNEYFDGEDVFGGWMGDCIEVTGDEEDFASSLVLFRSWSEWANARHEVPGSAKRLAQALVARGFQRKRERGTGHRGFCGLKVKQDGELSRLLTN